MSWQKGKLIVIEGGDGAGKATQAGLLFKSLINKRSVTLFEFPRYKQSNFGRLIRRSLDGEFGDFLTLSPYLSALPYMLDRARAKYLLLEALKEGDVICDRYTPSNIAHQGAKLPVKDLKALISFIEESEYKELGLPEPDIVLYLWVPAILSGKLLQTRAEKEVRSLDSYELKKEYQKRVVDTYLRLSKQRKNWHIVSCTSSSGKLLNPKEVHKKIFRIIKQELKI